jgi:glutathionylspermidine synthase
MQRHVSIPRPDWRKRVESIGLTYHSHETGPYWDESAYYELTAQEVDVLEAAANKLHFLCIDAAEAVIKNNWWPRLGIPETAVPAILRSWERDDFSLYGRFDFSFDGITPPKLLEYNADTPTALVEAAVAQWFWLQDMHPDADQFNSIHERLIEAWRRWRGTTIHFSSIKEHLEDEQTVLYLRDTCEQAGVKTKSVFIEDIGWDRKREKFVDLDEKIVEHCFKLYPWEWLWHEEFSTYLSTDPVQFIEPTWKMLLSNKGLLPILWELFPDHPNLLPAYEIPTHLGECYIRKPKLSREGANVTWVEGGAVVEETAGDYGEEGFVYQALANVPDFSGNHPIFGVWVVDHEAAGLGIREDTGRITGNLSRFVPHFFRHSP